MSTVHHAARNGKVHAGRTPVQQVLRSRPFLQTDLVPLAVFLCEEGYSNGARNVILSSVRYGADLADLVRTADLEPADLAGALEALRRGRESVGLRGPVAFGPPEADEDADIFDGEEDIALEPGPSPEDLEHEDEYRRRLAESFDPPDAPEDLTLADAVEREMLAIGRRPGAIWRFVADQLGELVTKIRLVETDDIPLRDPAEYLARIEALDHDLRVREYDRGYSDGAAGTFSAR